MVTKAAACKKVAEEVSESAPTDELVVRKRELFNYVTENTSLKKREAREAVEATLQCLQMFLAEEKVLNIPPLGKIMSKRVKVGTPAEKVVYKLNLRKVKDEPAKESKEALAELED